MLPPSPQKMAGYREACVGGSQLIEGILCTAVKAQILPGWVHRRLRTSTMPSDLCAWHQMGNFSPGRLNTGRLPQPVAAHCRLRACSGNNPC